MFVLVPTTASGAKLVVNNAQFCERLRTEVMNEIGDAAAAPCEVTAPRVWIRLSEMDIEPVPNPMVLAKPVAPEVINMPPDV